MQVSLLKLSMPLLMFFTQQTKASLVPLPVILNQTMHRTFLKSLSAEYLL
jgi:hypothetical protein